MPFNILAFILTPPLQRNIYEVHSLLETLFQHLNALLYFRKLNVEFLKCLTLVSIDEPLCFYFYIYLVHQFTQGIVLIINQLFYLLLLGN